MLAKLLGLDEKDLIIINTYMQDPDVSQSKLAQLVKISQPSVYARITKLKQKGLLTAQYGIDTQKAGMSLVRVDCKAKQATKLLDHLKHCSFFAHGFTMSGIHNVCIFIVAHNLEKVQAIIDINLRQNPDVDDIVMSVVVSSAKPFPCQIDLVKEQHEGCQSQDCTNCHLHK